MYVNEVYASVNMEMIHETIYGIYLCYTISTIMAMKGK